MTELRPVRVVWYDSVLLDGWVDIDSLEYKGPSTVDTVGYLVHSDEFVIHVASAVHEHEAAGIVRIPVASIVSQEDLMHVPERQP